MKDIFTFYLTLPFEAAQQRLLVEVEDNEYLPANSLCTNLSP